MKRGKRENFAVLFPELPLAVTDRRQRDEEELRRKSGDDGMADVEALDRVGWMESKKEKKKRKKNDQKQELVNSF